jgi:hypothetical protein
MGKRRLFGFVFFSTLSIPYWACTSSGPTDNLPSDCEARCQTDTPMGMWRRVACLSSDPGRCLTPTGGLAPRCDDGTPISIALCQNDGHAKCKNGAEPVCVVQTGNDGGGMDSSRDSAPDVASDAPKDVASDGMTDAPSDAASDAPTDAPNG